MNEQAGFVRFTPMARMGVEQVLGRGRPATAPTPQMARAVMAQSRPLCAHSECELDRCAVELVQRGQIILDVSIADLETAERVHGSFHPTTWHFRNALGEVRRTWACLCAELGANFIEAALDQPPLTVLTLGKAQATSDNVNLILIAGQTYQIQAAAGTELAPVQWQITRLNPPLSHGPYYICRLVDGSIQCDCADWTYRIAETSHAEHSCCKHVNALSALGWI